MTSTRSIALAVVVTSAIVALAACQGGAPGGSPPPSPPPSATGGRPSSPAVIKILQPAAGATVTGKTLHIVISLEGAQIVAATTTDVRPDQGHVHLYVDNSLVSMNYGLEQDIAVELRPWRSWPPASSSSSRHSSLLRCDRRRCTTAS